PLRPYPLSLHDALPISPRADHLGRLAALVADEAQLVAHPAVGAILLEKPILDGVPAFLEQVTELGLHRREVVGVDTAPPEIRALDRKSTRLNSSHVAIS